MHARPGEQARGRATGATRRDRLAARLERAWQSIDALSAALYPLSWLYRALVATRRAGYRHGLLSRHHPGTPVVVVGNITVGGSGKTPFTLWLARWLGARGHRPGIVLRGYRGTSAHWPRRVLADSPASEVGDEAVLLARTSGVPVVAGPNRVEDCRVLLAEHACDVIISDDGLQHLALARDFEIVLHDAKGEGNGWCLPAGPLREPLSRLGQADLVVAYGDRERGAWPRVERAASLSDPARVVPLSSFQGQRLLLVTAIARPRRVLDALADHGLAVDARLLPDHHPLSLDDMPAQGYDAILVTAKDAVKLPALCALPLWVVQLELDIAPSLVTHLERELLPRLAPSWSTSTS